ncbi:hypothetical protein MUG78_17870 [Gordonia alkaliphila]|uniref:hypothetical protein n=1 Tax=Gordonia alkaliphila TaxID=1053547 RepID=UPI001FF1D5E9|nr:hypothetical protein [Gordonia alkaliphila]MCK0441270.1 hypothetical protein [Gordonia alkaliphila]
MVGENQDELQITVYAEILPGKVDPASVAAFANSNRAATYAQQLAAEQTYSRVALIDHNGTEWDISE